MRRGIPFGISIALLAAVAGCGREQQEGGDPVPTDRVTLPKSYRFEPPDIEVQAGTTVTWTNRDDFPHNVHLLDGSDVTEQLPVGESAEIAFEDPGTIEYECSLHPQQMRGSVTVT